MKREHGKVYLRAELWYCGDDHCDCHQPQIEVMGPNPFNPQHWNFLELWRGTFISGPTGDEMAGLALELTEACTLFGIPQTEKDSIYTEVGCREAIEEERQNYWRRNEEHVRIVKENRYG